MNILYVPGQRIMGVHFNSKHFNIIYQAIYHWQKGNQENLMHYTQYLSLFKGQVNNLHV